MGHIRVDGQRLAYTVHGRGPRTTVLLPGLLMSQKMQIPLARELARHGNRVITLDPLGHGRSDRPPEPWRYSMGAFAGQTLALLDHLRIERALVGGTSLGANVALELASRAPERMVGMLAEMPVLDNAIAGCGAAFTPLLFALRFGAPAVRALGVVARAAGRAPWIPGTLAELGLDWVAQDPVPSAAVLNGLLYGRVAPDHGERTAIEVPTLVIGHARDPIHPLADAEMLAGELPDARLVRARSILELRMRPERLTAEIVQFVAGCWEDAAPASTRLAAA